MREWNGRGCVGYVKSPVRIHIRGVLWVCLAGSVGRGKKERRVKDYSSKVSFSYYHFFTKNLHSRITHSFVGGAVSIASTMVGWWWWLLAVFVVWLLDSFNMSVITRSTISSSGGYLPHWHRHWHFSGAGAPGVCCWWAACCCICSICWSLSIFCSTSFISTSLGTAISSCCGCACDCCGGSRLASGITWVVTEGVDCSLE